MIKFMNPGWYKLSTLRAKALTNLVYTFSFFPIFDNTILIDPVQRQREHFGQQAAAIYSENHRSVIRHNCLNHHPYGTFYYRQIFIQGIYKDLRIKPLV